MTERSEPRWWQRALPATVLAGIAATVAVATVPGLSDEIKLSTSRTPQPFVELFLGAPTDGACASDQPRLRFRVQSHLLDQQELTGTIAVDPEGAGQTVLTTGTLLIAPGEEKIRDVPIAAPASGAYTVTLSLTDRPETLRVHCDGGTS